MISVFFTRRIDTSGVWDGIKRVLLWNRFFFKVPDVVGSNLTIVGAIKFLSAMSIKPRTVSALQYLLVLDDKSLHHRTYLN